MTNISYAIDSDDPFDLSNSMNDERKHLCELLYLITSGDLRYQP